MPARDIGAWRARLRLQRGWRQRLGDRHQRAQVVATIDVGKRPRGMKIDRAGARLIRRRERIAEMPAVGAGRGMRETQA